MNRAGALLFTCTVLLVGANDAWAKKRSSFKYNFNGKFDGKIAAHLLEPHDLASQKLSFAMDNDFKWKKEWKASVGFRAWHEGAYSINDRYPDTLVRNDSTDLRVRDAYIEYNNDSLSIRMGNQQVVWGEAFGFFYSDIVNPKDLRDGGFGDLSDTRLQTPIANLKWILDNFSVQGIYSPKPYFSLYPGTGSDFFPTTVQPPAPFETLSISRETTLPFGKHEGGGKVSALIGVFDFSLFFFSYYDRAPYLEVDLSSTTATQLGLRERHGRVNSAGFTVSAEIGDFVVRGETVFTGARRFSTATTSSIQTARANQYLYVLGVDLPPFSETIVGIQWSQDFLNQEANYLNRDRVENLASIRAERMLFLNHTAIALFAFNPNDLGSRAEFIYKIPLSNSFETHFGFDLLAGPADSRMGAIKRGSRAFVQLSCFFKG